mmetsp:Transcript_17361/g.20078  ORF Transcript_17361/g.20078 Transcript_17361/m.20078 type:complete len:364 (+) Transcript_17361:448-1539(+)
MGSRNPLRMLAVFSEMNDKRLDKLLNEVFTLINVPKGTVLYEESEPARTLYFVYTGKVALTVKDENGLVLELTRLTQLGSSFGTETFAVKGALYDSTACTLEDSVLVQLPLQKMDKLQTLAPKIADQMKRISMDRAAIKTISERIPTFRTMSAQKQHQMSVISQFVKFVAGDIIFHQDAHSENPSFYIVTKGCVEVLLDSKKVKEIHVGDYFGEVGLVSNKPHSATIQIPKNSDDVYCLKISNTDFKELFLEEPTVLAEFTLRAYGEDVPFVEFIKHPKARASFLEYCETEYAGENLDYLSAVENLENINKRRMRKSVLRSLSESIEGMKTRKKELCARLAKDIIESWVLDDSPNPVSMAGGG